MNTIADLIARVKEIDHFTNSDFAAEARTLLPAVVEMLEECMRQRRVNYQFQLSAAKAGYDSVGLEGLDEYANSKLLGIAKKHGVISGND